MAHPDLEVLAGLALDPAEVDADVRTHVDACAECRALVEALSDVHDLAAAGEPLTPAPAGVRARVLAEARRSEQPPAAAPVVPIAAAERRRSGVPLWLAGAAAAVTLVAGVVGGRLSVDDPAPPVDRGTVVAAADLTALDSDAPRGEASAVRSKDTVTLRVAARELGDEDGFHEVWLINVDGSRMVALGVLAEGDTGEFDVPLGLIDEGYRIVDISVEPDDGDPTHSGVSLARGELA
ncbi:hypothetical protein J2X46_000840 [Nocardioides sp. BE266]|uniref:anti-sigma factor n=1 Tax=Nocardioides sp. BE266 TaxID=2817725 RepID=UPI002859410B|nr:anti-sigma factor [Nocardioides sp. BE266]MDR7251868.1 hypothetical protein [Nocardioides sp. BE266]